MLPMRPTNGILFFDFVNEDIESELFRVDTCSCLALPCIREKGEGQYDHSSGSILTQSIATRS